MFDVNAKERKKLVSLRRRGRNLLDYLVVTVEIQSLKNTLENVEETMGLREQQKKGNNHCYQCEKTVGDCFQKLIVTK